MGIISTLKSVLGVGRERRERARDPGTSVTVEREPEAASERAVKGVEPADDGDPAGDGEPVDAIKGIGSAYAERLGDAGVHTVADLAAADVETLAEETGLGEGRIAGWIEHARART